MRMVVSSLVWFLTFSFNAYSSEQSQTYYVTTDVLNVRTAPNSDASLVTKITKNTAVTFYKTEGDWAKISDDSSPSQWIFKKYTSKNKSKIVNILIKKADGLKYEPNEDKPYTGEFVGYEETERYTSKKIENYKDGKLHGLRETYADGILTSKGNFVNGLAHGSQVNWNLYGKDRTDNEYNYGKTVSARGGFYDDYEYIWRNDYLINRGNRGYRHRESDFISFYTDEVTDWGTYKMKESEGISSINDIFSVYDKLKGTTQFIKANVVSINGSAVAKNDRSSLNSFTLDLSRASGNSKEYIIKNCDGYKGCDLLFRANISDNRSSKRLDLFNILEKKFDVD